MVSRADSSDEDACSASSSADTETLGQPYHAYGCSTCGSLSQLGVESCGTARSVSFPHHLISGCSTAGNIMCQYSQTMTSHVVRRRIGIKGTFGVGVGKEGKPPTDRSVSIFLAVWTLRLRHRSRSRGVHDARDMREHLRDFFLDDAG